MSIHIESLTFRYQSSDVLNLRVENVHVEKGQCVVLCGKSGSGKSTFLRVINGLVPEYYEGDLQGEGHVNQQPIGTFSVDERSFSVGSVFQNPMTQFFHDIVEDELVFPCENQGVPANVIACRLKEVGKNFQLKALMSKSLYAISGGQRQKVAIATAFMQHPDMIVMDEPTANLDKQGVEMIKKLIETLKQSGVTVVIAEQRLAYLYDLADQYLYFENGTLVNQWTKEDMQRLSVAQLHDYGLRSPALASAKNMIGHKQKLFRDAQATRQPSLLLKHVTIGYPKRPLFPITTLQLPLGHIIGITGSNGVGKTTFIKSIAGLLRNTGEYYWHAKKLSDKERLKNSTFVLQEVRMQLFSSSVAKEIALGSRHLSRQAMHEVCDTLGLTELLDKHPMTLSGGQQQRVMIANALLSHKKIFIFDEVTSGLCFENMQKVVTLIKSLKQADALVLVVSHDEEFLSAVSDMICDLDTI